MYRFVRPLLFYFDPEIVHEFVIGLCRVTEKAPFAGRILARLSEFNDSRLHVVIGNLRFPNPIGLAAGFDKNGHAAPILQALGFGALEVGTVTPTAQPGNPKPRLFRLKEDRAIINRMGFNNEGVDALVNRLKGIPRRVPIGINLGKNRNREIKEAVEDYTHGLQRAWEAADYFTINISSPNTQNLRRLQQEEHLVPFLKKILDVRNQLALKTNGYKQIWLKIAPDMENDELEALVDTALRVKIDALVISNTTVSRSGLTSEFRKQTGGLSGRPIRCLSDRVLEKAYVFAKGQIPLIGVGGIFTAEDVYRKLALGASMVQIYTGFVYQGPWIVRCINRRLVKLMMLKKHLHIRDITGCAIRQ